VMVTVKERQLALLEWFVVRARRIEEHSLGQDKDQLLTWASGTFTVSGVQGQSPTSVCWDLPPEEPLDSLAARCRPFILKNDPVYWVNVTGALGYFLRDQDAEDLTARLGALRTSWRGLDKDTRGSLGFQSRAGGNGDDLGELVDSKALAYAWLYGDLVHADDDIPERVGEHDIDDRYRAGAILIANVALHAIVTLNLVRVLQRRGFITLPAEVFAQPVKANPDAELTISQAITGPAGTSVAVLEAALDAGRARPGDPAATADSALLRHSDGHATAGDPHS
jgi:hypothetical protein